jgi:hypothetical protein
MEIKFRAWHKIRKEMYNVLGFYNNIVFPELPEGEVNLIYNGSNDDKDDVILMKSTGFQVQGVDLYDGDILSDEVNTDEGKIISKQQVFWHEKKGQWHLDNSHKQDKTYSSPLYRELELFNYKINGNIHETRL